MGISWCRLGTYADILLLSTLTLARGEKMLAARIVPSPSGGSLSVEPVPDPIPGPGEVLVRVFASGVNRGELKMVAKAQSGAPRGIGVEFVGVVDAVGEGVDQWVAGDKVLGHGTGGQAELVVAADRALMRMPEGLPWIDAATFPNVFITAHDALVTNGRLAQGETVLVNAAASGIALAATRIAKSLAGATVIATTRSPAKAQRLLELGADHVIVVGRDDQAEVVRQVTDGRGVDIVIDSVGGTDLEVNLSCLAVKGRLVNIGRLGSSSAHLDLETLWFKRLHLIGVTFQTRTEEERFACIEACGRDLLPKLAQGELSMPVDRTFPLEAVADAHEYMATDAHVGKIVIVVAKDLLDEEAGK
ncbi:quinone oxidoreductase family protein [Rhodococcus opacus]|uniref:quinone oxidoreductase family protein n=1 Tax=Rhodococcus opacus TaxID=37919 RepID=UPI001F38D599|nr:zinc-binding dehydrogenase [Rhodococcus opacus]